MPFRFNLSAVLRFRQHLEEQAKQMLNAILAEVAATTLELGQLERQREQMRAALERELKHPLPASYLQQRVHEEGMLTDARDTLLVRLQQLEARRVDQLGAFRTARQNREILAELCQHQQHRYLREQARAEQKNLDELFLARLRKIK